MRTGPQNLFLVAVSICSALGKQIKPPFDDTKTVKKEITLGVWVGDEKFIEEGENFPYCSRAIFLPEENNKIFTWLSAEGTCKDVGVDQVTGEISGDWFGSINPADLFVEQIFSTECLPASECGDVISMPDKGDVSFNRDYKVSAISCGRNYKIDLTSSTPEKDALFCDAWQVSLLKRKNKENKMKQPENLVLLTLSYGPEFNEISRALCPRRPIFKVEDMIADRKTEGSAQFVLQGNVPEALDPCNWDCFEDPDGICV